MKGRLHHMQQCTMTEIYARKSSWTSTRRHEWTIANMKSARLHPGRTYQKPGAQSPQLPEHPTCLTESKHLQILR